MLRRYKGARRFGIATPESISTVGEATLGGRDTSDKGEPVPVGKFCWACPLVQV